MAEAGAESGTGLALVAVSRRGAQLARRLSERWPAAQRYVLSSYRAEAGRGASPIESPLGPTIGRLFAECSGLVFFLPVGAVVRLIAPCLVDKRADPGVVAVDEAGSFAVCVLSGHAGGGNRLAERVAAALDARPIVTTATDRLGLPAPELLGQRYGWRLEANRDALLRASAALVGGGPIGLYQDGGSRAWRPEGVAWVSLEHLDQAASTGLSAGLAVTDRVVPRSLAERWVIWRPREVVAGLGCSSGVPADELAALLQAALGEAGLAAAGLGLLATIDRRLAEPGLRELAERLGLELRGFGAAELAEVAVPSPSETVRRAVGTPSVAEAAALLGAGGGELLLPKRVGARGTVALARRTVPDKTP